MRAEGQQTINNTTNRTRASAMYLIARGDRLSIEQGQLVIHPASKKPVSQKWLDTYRLDLLRQILLTLNMDAYVYNYYTTGNYVNGRGSGITLQFSSIVHGTGAYVIFNADLNRSRNTSTAKAGQRLPKNHFRVKRGSEFVRFWISTELLQPKRLSSFHDYMGKLKRLVFTAPVLNERMDARKIQPLSICAEAIRDAFFPDNAQTKPVQMPNKIRTLAPDKYTRQDQAYSGLQPDLPTGEIRNGKTVTSKRGYTAGSNAALKRKRPEEQTTDEWLSDYSQPEIEKTEKKPPHGSWQWN